MDHSIVLRLTPIFVGDPPHISLDINGKNIFHDKLLKEEEFKHVTPITSSVKIKIKRSGRTKKIVHDDPNNGFSISDFEINGVKLNPDIGAYHCFNNDYIEPHVVHGKKFTLNGEYCIEIPFFTLRGQITKKIKNLDAKGQDFKYCFFGASMTDYNFSSEVHVPPIQGKKNYADLFIEKMGGVNLAHFGQTNQEIVETVYRYYDGNKCDVAFVQLVSSVARQVKNIDTGEVKRYSPHIQEDLNWHDKFTQLKLKSIQEYFVYLDVAPIIALQILEYKKLIDYAVARGTKIFLVSYFDDEYQIFKKLLPNNVAPYFNIDPDSEYCRNNGYHATPEEHESYFQNLVDFVGKIK
tara:strand:- start:1112 stop:2164 length:1053 start_codon:yes stop_codon:yes gene_type:complete